MNVQTVVPCPICLQPLTLELESGEPQTYEYPGSPDQWYLLELHECTNAVDWNKVDEIAFASEEYQHYARWG